MLDNLPPPLPGETAVGPEPARQIPDLSRSAWWRGVDAGRFPAPFYPAPRSPRWYPSQVRWAMEQHRMLPREAKELRRRDRLAQSEQNAAESPPSTAPATEARPAPHAEGGHRTTIDENKEDALHSGAPE